MIREEIFNSIIDFYQHMVGHLDDMTKTVNTIENSMLIPKPKFRVGDKVKLKGSNIYPEFIVVDYSYSPEQKTWKYEGISSSNKSVEDALELVEDKK